MPKGNPFGSKSSVVAKRSSKKRSGFRGTPGWRKKVEESRPKDATQLTFIPDCDVGGSA